MLTNTDDKITLIKNKLKHAVSFMSYFIMHINLKVSSMFINNV